MYIQADNVFILSSKVRDSLEKVRERMYGQFGGMQQSVQKLSQELKVSKMLHGIKVIIYNVLVKINP